MIKEVGPFYNKIKECLLNHLPSIVPFSPLLSQKCASPRLLKFRFHCCSSSSSTIIQAFSDKVITSEIIKKKRKKKQCLTDVSHSRKFDWEATCTQAHGFSVGGGDGPGHCQITQIDVRLFLKNIISAIATNSASFSWSVWIHLGRF